jgi:hypothetical protein
MDLAVNCDFFNANAINQPILLVETLYAFSEVRTDILYYLEETQSLKG